MPMLVHQSPKWNFVILSLLLATLSGVVIYAFFPSYLGLVLLFFYIILSNSFIPFPHEPAIIFYGKVYGPWLTTLVAMIPTLIACIIDYAVLIPVFSRTRLANLKNTRIYRTSVTYFHKAPFLTNFIAAISPLPFYPVRIWSVASEYPLWKYATSVLLGRIPRYYLLALFGAVLNIPNWMIVFFFVSLVAVPVYRRMAGKTGSLEASLGEESLVPSSVKMEKESPSAFHP